MPKISILICSLTSRAKLLQRLLKQIDNQLGDYIDKAAYSRPIYIQRRDYGDIEVLVCIDDKALSVGEKRNILKENASGGYFGYIDDDDTISKNYCEVLLEAAKSARDVLSINAHISQQGGPWQPVYYSINYDRDANRPGLFERLPNHLCYFKQPFKRFDFPEIDFQEDAKWAQLVRKHIKNEYKISEFIYKYHSDFRKSETIPEDVRTTLQKQYDRLHNS